MEIKNKTKLNKNEKGVCGFVKKFSYEIVDLLINMKIISSIGLSSKSRR